MRVSPPPSRCMKTQNYILVQSRLFPATVGPLTQMELRSGIRTREKVLRFVNYNQACVRTAHGGSDRERKPFLMWELCVDYIFWKPWNVSLGKTFQEAACKEKKELLGNLKSAALKQIKCDAPVCKGVVLGSWDSVLLFIVYLARNVA